MTHPLLGPGWKRRGACLAALAVLAGALPPPSLPAQGITALSEACAGEVPELAAWCQELALASVAIQRGIGLASALGSDIPGSPSTMGRRLGSMPRISVSFTGLGLRVGMPDIGRSSGTGVTRQETFSLLGARLGAAIGTLDGFQLAPTIGGVLSVDLIGSYSFARLPPGPGFHGSASGFGLGGRLGLLRESFTLPGISVSAIRRWHGNVRVGAVGEGDAGEVETDVTATSYRATVGKNFFALGLLGGMGWDRYRGDARLLASLEGAGGPSLGVASGRESTERTLYFVAGWFNFLVYQLSGEVGRASGTADPFSTRSGTYDPGSTSWFASVALRITL